jgi:hypothetical protein
MEKKKHYLVYKTTCLLNGKIYIGQHQTYDINDDYLGSGIELNEDIDKFGRENFKREILFDFDNIDDMDNKEKELVTEEFISRPDTYNMRVGGQKIDPSIVASFGGKKYVQMMHENQEWWNVVQKKISRGMKRVWKEHPEKFVNFRCDWTGKHHTEQAKQKMREKNKVLLRGERNGSFGKVWIYNESLRKNLMVRKE